MLTALEKRISKLIKTILSEITDILRSEAVPESLVRALKIVEWFSRKVVLKISHHGNYLMSRNQSRKILETRIKRRLLPTYLGRGSRIKS